MLPRSLQVIIRALSRLLTPAVFLSLWLAVTPAWAGSMLLLGAGSAGSALPGPPVLTFVFVGGLSNSGSTLTAATVTLGPTAGFTTRRIIIIITANVGAIATGTTFTGGTINGVATTTHVQTTPDNALSWCSVLSADVPSGNTNQTVTLTFSGTVFNSSFIFVYSVDDALMASTTPTGVGSNTTASSVSALSTSASFNQTVNGFVVSAAGLGGNGTSATMTGYTTDYNNSGGGTNGFASHLSPIASTGTASTAATWTTAQAGDCIAAAAWR